MTWGKACKGKNQQCVIDDKENYCGTKNCRDVRDCKDVGHVISGKNVPTKCYKGRCSYSPFQMIT